MFGFGEIMRYFSLLKSSGEYSAGGLNFMKFYEANQVGFMPSIRLHTALNGSGSGNGQHAITDGSPGHEHGHEHGQHPVTDGTPGTHEGPVAVPGHAADPETWAPPPWPPPSNPASGAPEGPAAR